MERKKPSYKRSQDPQKGIWTAVKDNAALGAAIVALFGVLITGAVNTYIANKDEIAQRKLEAFNAERQRELEQEKAQNAALQTYLDQMGQMLINQDLRSSEEGKELRTLARAKTLSVFEQASPAGKRIALVFLNEAALIDNPDPVISLYGADLSDANLRNINLQATDLSGADLSDTDLSQAVLTQTNLSQVNLGDANLTQAYLIQANLSGTNLTGVKGLTAEQLSSARSLEGTTMPDGQSLKSDDVPDRPTFEEWLKSLKSKGSGENGENGGSS